MNAAEPGRESAGRSVAELHEEIAELRSQLDNAHDELERTNQGVVALYAEIDDKNAQLSQANAAKTRFLRSISHEFRTPVNSILGLTGLLLDPRQPERLNPEQTEQVEYVRASATDLLSLVEELMDLAKAESGRLEAQVEEFSVSDHLSELRAVIEPILKDGVRLEIAALGADRVRTDPDLLRHVLRNLLSNAAKFTTAGSVTLTATVDDELDQLEVVVTDTGVGISDDDLPRIFEEFYQASTPLHAGVRGTGLGLPFAQLVARALGGEIHASSQPGVGSSFRLTITTGAPAAEPTDREVPDA